MPKAVIKPPKYALSYGLACGPLSSRRLRKQLAKAGFKAASQNQADIIIAHSAGCWLTPTDLRPKLVIYIGAPLNKSSSAKVWRATNSTNLRVNGLMQNIRTLVFSIYYLLTQPKRNWNIIRHPKIGEPMTYTDSKSLFIANQYDPWPKSTNIEEFMTTHNSWGFLSLEGGHDTLWEHPEEFIEVIKIHAARLLA